MAPEGLATKRICHQQLYSTEVGKYYTGSLWYSFECQTRSMPPRPLSAELALQHERPRHDKVHDPRGQRTRSQDGVPVPPAPVPPLELRAAGRAPVRAGVVRRLDDVRGDPHLDRAAAARRRANGRPAHERVRLVVEEREREVCRGPADRWGRSAGGAQRSRGRTLQREEPDERRQGRVVDAPALEEAGRQLQTLPAGEH